MKFKKIAISTAVQRILEDFERSLAGHTTISLATCEEPEPIQPTMRAGKRLRRKGQSAPQPLHVMDENVPPVQSNTKKLMNTLPTPVLK